MLPSGRLAKHGYTVKWGFFEGVCPGSGRLPFEQSTDAIADAIVNVKKSIKSTEDEIATYSDLDNAVNDGTRVWVHIYANSTYMWVKARLHSLTTDRVTYSRPYSQCQFTTHDAFCNYRKSFDKAPLTQRVEAYDAAWEMHTIQEWSRYLNLKYAKTLEAANAQRRSWLSWQAQRVASWKPMPLTPR